MAVQATAALFYERVNFPGRNLPWGNAGQAGSAMTAVALVANQRRPSLQQVVGGSTVRHVAVAAIVVYRLVVMNKGTALLHVTRVAGLYNAISLDKLGPGRAMHVVAVGAGHLPFEYRMVRLAIDLRALLLMAGKADVRLGSLVTHLVLFCVDLMTGVARNVPRLVCATRPEVALRVLLVACQARVATDVRRSRGALSEGSVHLGRLPAALVSAVLFAVAVAVGTCGGSLVCKRSVLGLAY